MRVYPPDWRLVKVDQRWACNKAWVTEKKIESCGVFYLVDANLHVHICSLTPSLEAWAVQGFATFETPEACEADEGETETAMLNAEESAVSYFDAGLLLRSPHQRMTYVDTEPEDGETDEAYRARIAEEVREYLCGNPVWF